MNRRATRELLVQLLQLWYSAAVETIPDTLSTWSDPLT